MLQIRNTLFDQKKMLFDQTCAAILIHTGLWPLHTFSKLNIRYRYLRCPFLPARERIVFNNYRYLTEYGNNYRYRYSSKIFFDWSLSLFLGNDWILPMGRSPCQERQPKMVETRRGVVNFKLCQTRLTLLTLIPYLCAIRNYGIRLKPLVYRNLNSKYGTLLLGDKF